MGVKSAVQSVTVWGAAVVILCQLLNLAGYTVSADDQQQLTNLINSGAAAVTTIVSIAGGGLAIYGRVRAQHKITGVMKAKPLSSPS